MESLHFTKITGCGREEWLEVITIGGIFVNPVKTLGNCM